MDLEPEVLDITVLQALAEASHHDAYRTARRNQPGLSDKQRCVPMGSMKPHDSVIRTACAVRHGAMPLSTTTPVRKFTEPEATQHSR